MTRGRMEETENRKEKERRRKNKKKRWNLNTDKDIIANAKRVVSHDASAHPTWRLDDAARRDDRVAADVYRRGRRARCRGGCRGA